jgi:hypothetical protein
MFLFARKRKIKKHFLIELYGWYGVLAILSAYVLQNFSILSGHSYTYQILNLSGALGIVSVSLQDREYQEVVLNIIWATVALIGIASLIVGIQP